MSFARAIELEEIGGRAGGIEALAVSADGREALVGGASGGLALWDLDARTERADFAGSAVSLAAAGPGRWLVGARDLLRLDLTAGSGDRLYQHPGDDERPGRVLTAIAVSTDGRRAFAAFLDESEVLVFDLERGALERRLKKAIRDGLDLDGIRDLVPSADGRWLYAAGMNHRVQVFDVAGEGVARELAGHSAPVHRLALTARGGALISAGGDRRVKLWKLTDNGGMEVADFAGHDGPVTGLAALPGGRRAISAALDGSIRVLDLLGGRPLVAMSWSAEISALALAPATECEPERLVLASRDGRLALAVLQPGADVLVSPPRDLARPVVEKPSTAIEMASAAQEARALIAEARAASGLAAIQALRRAQEIRGFARDGEVLEALRAAGRGRAATAVGDCWRRASFELDGPVAAAAFSPSGGRFILGLKTGSALIYDLKSGALLSRLTLSRAPCEGVGFLSESEAFGVHHRRISIAKVGSGAVLREVKVSLGTDEGLSHVVAGPGFILADRRGAHRAAARRRGPGLLHRRS